MTEGLSVPTANTTSLVQTLSNKTSSGTNINSYTYSYDAVGNIKSITGSAKHVKFTYSSSDTCRAVAVGGTLDGGISIGVGYTNYYEVWNNIV